MTSQTSSINPLTTVTVELRGHLIDSLTLAKVIDLIQSLDGDYHLNHLCIGNKKNQLSFVNLTVFASTSEKLQEILEQIKPYGAQPASQEDVMIDTCQGDGQVNEASILFMNLPAQVRLGGEWIPVNSQETPMTVVVDKASKKAKLTPVSQVRKGDLVVRGTHGIQWFSVGTEGA